CLSKQCQLGVVWFLPNLVSSTLFLALSLFFFFLRVSYRWPYKYTSIKVFKPLLHVYSLFLFLFFSYKLSLNVSIKYQCK
ncbi:hypothetical protein AB4K20DRAFT_1895753, partial [Rhizopus microsporus]